MEDVDGFSKKHSSMKSAWRSGRFYFVNLALMQCRLLVGLSHWKEIQPWNLPKLVCKTLNTMSGELEAVFENYSECYHCPLVHRALETLRRMIQRKMVVRRAIPQVSCQSRLK
jgi:hypothetical protein